MKLAVHILLMFVMPCWGKSTTMQTILANPALRAAKSCLLATSLFVSHPSLTLANVETVQMQINGLKKGRLLPCKTISNCISTSSINSIEKYGRPWTFENDPKSEFNAIIEAIKSDSFLKIVDTNDDILYIRAEAKSAVPPSGIDDIEFLVNGLDKIIAYRSNSRETLMAGTQLIGDGGSNRNRLESIKRKLGVSEMKVADDADDYFHSEETMQLFDKMMQMSQPNAINFVDNSVPE